MKKSILFLALVAILVTGTALAGEKELVVRDPGFSATATPIDMPAGDRTDVLFESFEAAFPPTGWTTMTSGASYSWEQSNSWAHSGQYSALVQYGPTGAYQDEWLITPALNTVGLEVLMLEFYESESYWANWGLAHYIMVSTTVPDDPAAYSVAIEWTPANHIIDPEIAVTVDLSAYVGYETVYMAIRYTGDYADDWWVDDVYLFEPPEHDIKAVAALPDGQTWVAGSTITPQLAVKNNGQNTETFDISMAITEGGVGFYDEVATVTGLPAGDTVTVDFPTFTCDVGIYEFTGTAMLVGDEEPSNDVATATNACYSNPRTPFGMLYTNWDCGPCVSANQALDAWYPGQGNDASLVRVHVWWPGDDDPMYASNIEQCTYLHSICAVDVWGVPCLLMDNTPPSTLDVMYGDWAGTVVEYYAQSAAQASPLVINMTYGLGQAHVLVNVTDEMPAGDYVLYVAVTEDNVYAPGGNGETHHNQAFRYLYPSVDGIPVSTASGYQEFTVDLTLDPSWDYLALRATAWVMGYPNGAVMNSATMFLHESTLIDPDNEFISDDTPQLITKLEGAFPNPFNPKTNVIFTLDTRQHVKVSIFDMTGRRVAELADGMFEADRHSLLWDGKDSLGNDMASGTYLIYMATEETVRSSKMTLVR